MLELFLAYLTLKHAPALMSIAAHTAAGCVRLMADEPSTPQRTWQASAGADWSPPPSLHDASPVPAAPRSTLADDMPTGTNEYGEVE
jgi:hypothetical protein